MVKIETRVVIITEGIAILRTCEIIGNTAKISSRDI